MTKELDFNNPPDWLVDELAARVRFSPEVTLALLTRDYHAYRLAALHLWNTMEHPPEPVDHLVEIVHSALEDDGLLPSPAGAKAIAAGLRKRLIAAGWKEPGQ